MNNPTTNNNNNNCTSTRNDNAISNGTSRHDIKTVHNDISSMPQHDNVNQRGIVGNSSSKNKHLQKIEKPGHNFGHDDHASPNQMSNGTNLKNSIHHINSLDGNKDSGWYEDEKIRSPTANNPSSALKTTLDNPRGREKFHSSQDYCAPHHQLSPVHGQPQTITTGNRLHHQFNEEHKPRPEQQDAKWWRREIQPTQQSAPLEDIRSVPTQNEYDCSGRCSNNVYNDVHNNNREQHEARRAHHWRQQQSDNELAGNKRNDFTVTSASDVDRSSSVGSDSLLNWMHDRQKAFRDFEQSFHNSGIGSGHNNRSIETTFFPEFQSFTPAGYALNDQSVSQYNKTQPSRSARNVVELLPFDQILQDPFFATPLNNPRIVANPLPSAHTKLKPIFNQNNNYNSNYNSSKSVQNEQENLNNMLSSRKESEEMSPKAKVSYDETKFQVEFDVKDYKPEELSIKTEGTTLVVLAKHEDKSGDSSYVTKQFEQRFTLPSGVKADAISSSLSRDGKLMVTAPRSVEQHKTPIGEIKWKTRDGFESDSSNTIQSSKSNEEGLPHPKVKYDEDKVCISIDCQKYKPEELDVKVEGNTIIITAKQEIKEIGGTRTRVFEQKFTLPSGVKGDKVTSSIDRDGVLSIIAPRGNASATTMNQTIEQKMDRVLSPSSWSSDFGSGGIHDDDFSSPRRSSSSTVTTKSSSNSSAFPGSIMFDHGDDFKNERSLFSHSDAMDNNDGISKVQYDDDTYKIMVNVENYKPEELTIKTVGNSVQVEAKHMEKTSDGRSFSSRNFSQTFSLPKGVNPEEVKSALSKDGTLTIEAPLPQPKTAIKGSERMVPITHHR